MKLQSQRYYVNAPIVMSFLRISQDLTHLHLANFQNSKINNSQLEEIDNHLYKIVPYGAKKQLITQSLYFDDRKRYAFI